MQEQFRSHQRIERDLESLADELIERLSRSNVILTAYPGFGKTTLASIIASRTKKFLYVARTHSEIEYFIDLLMKRGIQVTHAYGRKTVCVKSEALYSSNFMSACRLMVSSGRCSEPVDNKTIRSIYRIYRVSDIKNIEKNKGVCLYKANTALASKANRLASTYDYLAVHSEVLSGKDLYIFDEYHSVFSLFDIAIEVFNQHTIEAGVSLLKRDPSSVRLGYLVRSVFRKIRDIGIYRAVETIDKALAECGYPSDPLAKAYYRKLEEMLDMVYRGKYIYRNGSIVIIKSEFPFAKVSSRGALYMSAIDLSVAVSKAYMLNIDDVDPLVDVYIDQSLSSRLEKRDEMAPKLGKAVEDILSKESYKRALVVVHSRNLLNKIRKHGYLVGYPHAQDIADSEEKLTNYRVILDYAGGILTEGVDPQADLLIMVGAPYPSPSTDIDALSKVLNTNAYRFIAETRTIQALGRVARRRGRAYLLDDRFTSFESIKKSRWINTNII